MKRRDKLVNSAISKAYDFQVMLRALFQEWIEGRSSIAPDLLFRFRVPKQWVNDYAEFLTSALVVTELFGRLDAHRQVQRFQEFEYEGITNQTAYEFFSSKIPLLTVDFEALLDGYRSMGFTIAYVDSLSMLEKAQSFLGDAITQGDTLRTFAKKIEPLSLGLSAFHQETVFRTNMMSAYTAGQWESIQIAQEAFIQFDGIFDDRQRDNHRAIIYGDRMKPPGRIVPVSQVTTLPPFGYNCRCGFYAVSPDDVDHSLIEPFTPAEISTMEFKGIPQSPSTWQHRKRLIDNIEVDAALGGFERDLALSRARLSLMNYEEKDSYFAPFNRVVWANNQLNFN